MPQGIHAEINKIGVCLACLCSGVVVMSSGSTDIQMGVGMVCWCERKLPWGIQQQGDILLSSCRHFCHLGWKNADLPCLGFTLGFIAIFKSA